MMIDEFTHMSVAAAVLGGTADMGLGIFAAARALNLDFIPVVTEQYDLIIPERFFDTENIQHLLTTIRTPDFKHALKNSADTTPKGPGRFWTKNRKIGDNQSSHSAGQGRCRQKNHPAEWDSVLQAFSDPAGHPGTFVELAI